MTQTTDIIDAAYEWYCKTLNKIDRAIQENAEKKAALIDGYTTRIMDFCKEYPDIAKVVIEDNKGYTGIEQTQNAYHHTIMQHGKQIRNYISSETALDLSVLAIQIQLDIDNETITALDGYLKNQGKLEQKFEKDAEAVYQKVMYDQMPKIKIEHLFDEEEDISVEHTDPNYGPRMGSHCSGEFDTDRKKVLDTVFADQRKPQHTPDYHAAALSVFN